MTIKPLTAIGFTHLLLGKDLLKQRFTALTTAITQGAICRQSVALNDEARNLDRRHAAKNNCLERLAKNGMPNIPRCIKKR